MEPVRWGILGASKFAREQMAPAIHMAKGAELAALATSNPARAEGFLAFAPRMRVHDSYEALLADPGIDAVYIPLPNHLHVEWSLKAIAAGKHVLCEKPMAMNAGEYAQLIAARDASGLVVSEAYMIVHHPQWQRARELVREGAIGRLQNVDGFFSYDNSGDPGNIRNLPETGGGSLPDIGVYTCGSTRWVTGEEPEAVAAEILGERGGRDRLPARALPRLRVPGGDLDADASPAGDDLPRDGRARPADGAVQRAALRGGAGGAAPELRAPLGLGHDGAVHEGEPLRIPGGELRAVHPGRGAARLDARGRAGDASDAGHGLCGGGGKSFALQVRPDHLRTPCGSFPREFVAMHLLPTWCHWFKCNGLALQIKISIMV
jgi:hypothetical protein